MIVFYHDPIEWSEQSWELESVSSISLIEVMIVHRRDWFSFSRRRDFSTDMPVHGYPLRRFQMNIINHGGVLQVDPVLAEVRHV